MRNKFAELFVWISVIALHIAKLIAPSLAFDYMAYMAQEFMKEHISVIELEINGERKTVMPETFVMSRKDGTQ